VKVLGGGYIYPGYRQGDAVAPTAINGEPVFSSSSEGSGEDLHHSERRTQGIIGRNSIGISSSEALAMRINAQAAPVAPTTTTTGSRLMRPPHRRTRTVASIPQTELPPLPPPGISTPVPVRALSTPTPHAAHGIPRIPPPPPPTTTTYGATSVAVSLSARALRMVAEAMQSPSTSSGESAADGGSSGDSDTAAEVVNVRVRTYRAPLGIIRLG